ncbi:Xaa-Pro dipeptidase [Virgibacillus subterraneus]|uniref:Xaa-Pro dipeptidase n=2 Tax=Virgibacillus TaxID=84406 RepID=A0A1H1ATF3_9BACI|nr:MULTISPECIES: Xaa-Pro peptidase family protein [Virgibacillus]SDQ43028.1 Xaa-Pro dipeptidase [Virgibacillus salinus]SEQ10635.1 Xaa-Pro dipeptidase [Virgibacillus subterraneus]
MTNRLDTLLNELKKNNLDSMLVTSKANFYYLSNYYTEPHERVIAVYVSQYHDPLLMVPSMEVEDAKNAGWSYEIIGYQDHENPWSLFHDFLKRNNSIPHSISLEHNQLTLDRYHQIMEVLPEAVVSDGQEILANLRVIKSKKEYSLLKQAASLADFGIETGVKAINEGAGELEVIAKIEFELKKQGIQHMSFSTMALSGAKTASPHGTPSMKKIEKGDMVLFDLGVIFEGYCSDTTRTVAYKSITPEQEKIYNTVLEAERKSIEASKIGTSVGEIDLVARNHIEQAGYGTYFTHRIGHGLGIETHEYPSMHSKNQLPLKEGMCYTVEPGIYVPNTGGVRIEDMIFMTQKGPETLTKYPKELQIIG